MKRLLGLLVISAGAILTSLLISSCGGKSSPTPPAVALTATNSATALFSPTVTLSPTHTLSPVPTSSFTPSSTPSVTSTATVTSTSTVSATATLSPTDTLSPTASSTATPTSTSTISLTPTVTVSPSETVTFTETLSPTATISPTETLSPTETETSVPGWTQTATDTITFTLTSTPTSSESPTQTNSSTQTPTRSPTGTITLTLTATETSTSTLSSTPTQSATPTGTYTSINTPTQIVTYTLPVICKSQQLAVDSTGAIYVPSIQYNYILKYSGAVSTVIGGSGSANGLFSIPYGVAVDASDNLYVADTGNNRIQKFDSTGTFQWAVSVASGTTDTFINPMAVAVDGSGNVWATDYGNNRIVELSATGSPITTISGTFGGMAIYQPQGIAIDRTNNWVYVSNLFCCILRFKTDGTFLNTLGQYGSSGNGYFQTPYALAVNTAGTRLYVADPNLMKVTVLDPAGDYLESFGNYSMFGTGSPTGVAVDSSGNVYLSDIGDGEILEYGP